MYKFKYKQKTYSIPSGWAELTFGQWKGLQETNGQKEAIVVLSGLTMDQVNRLDDKSLFNLGRLLSFLNVPLNIDEFKAPEELVIKVNHKEIKIPLVESIKKKTFGQKIICQNMLDSRTESIYLLVVDVVLVYSQPIIEARKFNTENFKDLALYFEDVFLVDLYATGVNYIDQLKDIIELEAKALSSDPTPEQKAAGVDRFQQFGIMNTVKAMAQNDPLKYESILELDYNTCFTHMVMSKVTGDFQDDYRNIMKRKK